MQPFSSEAYPVLMKPTALSFPHFHRSLLWAVFQGFMDNSTSLNSPSRKQGIVSAVDLDSGKQKPGREVSCRPLLLSLLSQTSVEARKHSFLPV